MGVPANLSDAAALNASFDKEFVKNFQGESDRLAEILGIFAPEIKPAGTALNMLKVTGALNNNKTDATTTLPARAPSRSALPLVPSTSRAMRSRCRSSTHPSRLSARSSLSRTAR